jgi:N-acetylglutamate synthase-like GNAT family acetyltransferase
MSITYTNTITIEEYNFLIEAVGWGTRNTERVQMALERSDFLIAAQIDGKTIGMARVLQDGLQALVMDVVVLPEHQGQSIGKTLMGYVMEYLNDASHNGGLFVNLMCAVDREGFYEQFGFERRPNEKRGPGMTQWLEKKETAE